MITSCDYFLVVKNISFNGLNTKNDFVPEKSKEIFVLKVGKTRLNQYQNEIRKMLKLSG